MAAEYEWIPGSAPAGSSAAAEIRLGPGSISACLVVRHEAGIIERSLRSLAGVVDEVIVVHDGPCEDGTLELAERMGARVFVRPQYGHCERHLPFAYEQARGEWLLTIDADEFLSPELRSQLRALARATDVDGYEFLWRLWNGRRYVTERGPHKLALVRRRAMRMVGVIHSKGEVAGGIRRVELALEHQPRYDNFTIGTISTKWRARARLQALEYLSDPNTLPQFNPAGALAWSRRRQLANRWAPLLIVPAAAHTFFFVMRDLSGELGWYSRFRFALTQAMYRAMVTLYVARLRAPVARIP